ncbi:MAG: TerC family protein [Candidatus Margulisiibacteriota bacterium]
MNTHSTLLWVGFNAFILILLLLDMGVFHRNSTQVSLKSALKLSAFWIALALLFNVGVYAWLGPQPALEFFTGYVIEKSLSIDNLFVFLLIFSYFKVPKDYQHKVLFWGILGALVLRGVFIFLGVAVLDRFHWVMYIFGALLIVSGLKMGLEKEKEIHPENNPMLRLFKRLFRTTSQYDGDRFLTKVNGLWAATPLLIVLIVVETTDLIFAVDSIPAVLAITRDPFIVYSSNVFAILGLRALFFALSGIMQLFEYLHYGLSAILVFIGVKMVVEPFYHLSIGVSLSVIASFLAISVMASVIASKRKHPS